MATPKGIFYWSSRAKKEAEIDGTIGVAQEDDGGISHLKMAEPWAGEKIMARVPGGKIFGYTPIEGVESLRKKWLKYQTRNCPELHSFSASPVVVNGITHAIAIAGRMFLEPGQEIVTAEKSWENYEHIFTDAQQIKIMPFLMFDKNEKLNIDAIIDACGKAANKQGKVVLLLNFPHNQTGFMPTDEECKKLGLALQDACRALPQIPFVILLDDAYEGYVYDDGQKNSLLPQIFAPLANLTVVKLDGISKVMLAYGYRIGFMTVFYNALEGASFSEQDRAAINAEIGSKIGGFIRAEISQVNHHGQVLADALLDDIPRMEIERAEVIGRLRERWKTMMSAFEAGYRKYGKEKLRANPCNGGFFAYVEVPHGMDPKSVAERLLIEKKVGVVPGVHGLRIAFAGVSKEKISRLVSAVFEVIYGF